MLIGVTSFFRDPSVFDALGQRVLPNVLARRSGRELRIWSLGCSDGAELYSVAMLLAEAGVFFDESVHLLGTDCRITSTRQAATGIYDANAVAGLSTDRLNRFFERLPPTPLRSRRLPDAGSWRVVSALQRHTHWRTVDMLSRVEPGEWDIILCRNVSMYLRASAASMLWPALVSALRPGGYLVLGKAERPSGTIGLSCVENCIYRRH
jgi:chemotaxis methyl-accepting protein methylase